MRSLQVDKMLGTSKATVTRPGTKCKLPVSQDEEETKWYLARDLKSITRLLL